MPRAMTHLADRAHRLMLAALPGDIRRGFGDDMVQMFRDHRRHAAGARGRSSRSGSRRPATCSPRPSPAGADTAGTPPGVEVRHARSWQ